MEENKKEPPKDYTRIRFPTLFNTVEEAEAAKKRLDIYDAEVDLSKAASGLQGLVASCLPKPQRDWFIRRRIKMGIKWEIEMVDGHANYVFLPSGPLLKGLQATGGFGFMKIMMDVSNTLTKLLGYSVIGIVE